MNLNNIVSVSKRLHAIEDEVNDKYFGQEDVVHGLLLAVLAKQHIVLIGPWGEGKTAITEAICSRIGGRFFHWLVGKFTKEDELWGPVNIKKYLEDGVFEHLTTNKMPEAEVVLLDEIFKGNSGLLNMNLEIMENRRFGNGRDMAKVPLMTLIGASNELPKPGEGLEPFWDRFALRYFVKRLSIGTYGRQLLAKLREDDRRDNSSDLPTVLPLEDLKMAQTLIKQVELGDTEDALLKLWESLEVQGDDRSTRKFIQARTLLKAEALFQGRMTVETDDLLILQHILWDRQEEFQKMEFLIYRTIWPYMATVERHAAEAEQAWEEFTRLNPSAKFEKGSGLLKYWRTKYNDDAKLLNKTHHSQERSLVTIFLSRINRVIEGIEDKLSDTKIA